MSLCGITNLSVGNSICRTDTDSSLPSEDTASSDVASLVDDRIDEEDKENITPLAINPTPDVEAPPKPAETVPANRPVFGKHSYPWHVSC